MSTKMPTKQTYWQRLPIALTILFLAGAASWPGLLARSSGEPGLAFALPRGVVLVIGLFHAIVGSTALAAEDQRKKELVRFARLRAFF